MLRAVGRVETNGDVTMEQTARVIAGAPRLVLRALGLCFFVALWLLLSGSAADADGRDDAPGVSVSQAARDTVASTRGGVEDSRAAVKPAGAPVDDTVRHVKESGRRAADEAVRKVEAMARETADTIDHTADRVRAVAQQATRQVTEVVETPDPVVAPRPAPGQPAHERRQTDVRAPASDAADVHESLVAQENPALLANPVTPVLDLARAAAETMGATVVDPFTSPGAAPFPGAAPADAPPAHGGSGQQVPTPTQAAYVGDAVPAADLTVVTGALERALDPPADRATSPGTTPD
ncbi:MAG TPA: hypothetical protein VFK52_07430 [Nocardioidaceae bacterium]|nr:hypothetical protein [Nocardioidaceae bacterium]